MRFQGPHHNTEFFETTERYCLTVVKCRVNDKEFYELFFWDRANHFAVDSITLPSQKYLDFSLTENRDYLIVVGADNNAYWVNLLSKQIERIQPLPKPRSYKLLGFDTYLVGAYQEGDGDEYNLFIMQVDTDFRKQRDLKKINSLDSEQVFLKILRGHVNEITQIKRYGECLYSTGRDQTLRIWDWKQDRCLQTIVLPDQIRQFFLVEKKIVFLLDASLGEYDLDTNQLKIWRHLGERIQNLTLNNSSSTPTPAPESSEPLRFLELEVDLWDGHIYASSVNWRERTLTFHRIVFPHPIPPQDLIEPHVDSLPITPPSKMYDQTNFHFHCWKSTLTAIDTDAGNPSHFLAWTIDPPALIREVYGHSSNSLELFFSDHYLYSLNSDGFLQWDKVSGEFLRYFPDADAFARKVRVACRYRDYIICSVYTVGRNFYNGAIHIFDVHTNQEVFQEDKNFYAENLYIVGNWLFFDDGFRQSTFFVDLTKMPNFISSQKMKLQPFPHKVFAGDGGFYALDSTLFFLTRENHVIRYDLPDKIIKWDQDLTKMGIRNVDKLFGMGDQLFIQTTAKIFVLDCATGNLVRSYMTGSSKLLKCIRDLFVFDNGNHSCEIRKGITAPPLFSFDEINGGFPEIYIEADGVYVTTGNAIRKYPLEPQLI